ncbi:hypothetical protein EJB05_10855, partial [Eragrostis curvula]
MAPYENETGSNGYPYAIQEPQHGQLPVVKQISSHIPSSKALASKESDSPVPVLKVTLPGADSSTYTSTTLSQSISSLVLTPAIFLSFPFSTNEVTSPAYETVCLIFLNVCSFFFSPRTSHMNPASRL